MKMLPYWETLQSYRCYWQREGEQGKQYSPNPKKLILQWTVFFCSIWAMLLLCQLLGCITRYLVYCLSTSFLKLPGILQARFFIRWKQIVKQVIWFFSLLRIYMCFIASILLSSGLKALSHQRNTPTWL